MAWDCGAGHSFQGLIRRRLMLNIFPFPVSTAKFIGNFYNNRRSTAISCPRFTYSFVSLILHQYYWSRDLFSAKRRITAISCPRFAYSFVPLMLRQYYWSRDSFSANRRSAAIKKKSAKTFHWRYEFTALPLLAWRRCPASPLSAGSIVAPITIHIAP